MSKFNLILTSQGLTNVRAKAFTTLPRPLIAKKTNYQESTGGLVTTQNSFQAIETIQADEANATSVLGTPVFSNLILQSQDGSLSLRMDVVLITVSMIKKIVKTGVQGNNGTFKEYVSDGDFKVDIKGIFTSTSSLVYPREDVQTLSDLCALPESLEASSDFLDLFGVKNLVIERYKFNQKEGFYNTQPFTLNCISDEPLELLL